MPGLALLPPAPCARTKRQRGSQCAGCVKMHTASFLELLDPRSDRQGSRVAAGEVPCATFAFARAWWVPVASALTALTLNVETQAVLS